MTLAKGCIISRRPTRPDEFARPSGWRVEDDSSSSRGCPDAVGGEDHGARSLEVLATVAVEPRRAGDEAAVVRLEPAYPGAGHQPGAVGDRHRPVGEVGRGLRPLVAALHARAPLDARVAPLVGRREDRVGFRPPVPAEPAVCPGDLQPTGTDRQRRQRRVLARAGRPGHHRDRRRRSAGRCARSTAGARRS